MTEFKEFVKALAKEHPNLCEGSMAADNKLADAQISSSKEDPPKADELNDFFQSLMNKNK